MLIIDDFVVDLNGVMFFSILDLFLGYYQFELLFESCYVIIFSIYVGLRRYKCLFFGINVVFEIFQEKIREFFFGFLGCKNILDDIIVFGKDQEEYNKNFCGVFQRFKENNFCFNKDKCVFFKIEIKFYGYIFSFVGVRFDLKKVKVIYEV